MLSGHNSNRPVAGYNMRRDLCRRCIFFKIQATKIMILETGDFVLIKLTHFVDNKKNTETNYLNFFNMGSLGSKIERNRLSSTKRSRNKRKRRRTGKIRKLPFDAYIRRLNRTINPKMTIREDSMRIINICLTDFLHTICGEAKILCKMSGRKTLRAQDLSTAMRLWSGRNKLYIHIYSHLECKKALFSLAMSYATHQ